MPAGGLVVSWNGRFGLVADWPLACRLRHHFHASMPRPASAAPRILLGAKVSVLTRRLFPNPNMMVLLSALAPLDGATVGIMLSLRFRNYFEIIRGR